MSEYYNATLNRWSDGATRAHMIRYMIAKGFLERDDVVGDYGCGTGYGLRYLKDYCSGGIGIDREKRFEDCVVEDLNNIKVGIFCDVAICFEVMEHLENPKAVAEVMKEYTRKYILISFPNVPSTETNEFHKHDLTEAQVHSLVIDETWKPFGKLVQGVHDILIYYNSEYFND